MHPSKKEHMEVQLHQLFATHMDPSCSPHKATNHILYWIANPKTMVPKKTQKCGNTRSPCLDKPVLGRGGGGIPLKHLFAATEHNTSSS